MTTTTDTNDYKELLESAMQVLVAISHAQTFRDQRGDKVIIASYADLAHSEVRMLKGIISSNKAFPKKNWITKGEMRSPACDEDRVIEYPEPISEQEHFHDEGEKD